MDGRRDVPLPPDVHQSQISDRPTTDPTGLTHLGAREYDPTTGRFASIDPLFDLADPQSWNGYAYSSNNPITFSDPTGLKPKDPDLDDQFGREKPGTGKKKEWRPGSNPAPLTIDEAALFLYGMSYEKLPGGASRMIAILLLQCVNEGNARSCETVAAIPEINASAHALFGELTGVNDLEGCAQGSAGGCAWLAAGLIPFGKLTKVFKIFKWFKKADEVADLAKGLHGADLVVGPYGSVPRSILEAAAAADGPTTRVATNQTGSPTAGRALSVAYGDAADALAGQARAGGTLYTAQIPNALLQELERSGLVKYSTTQMGGVVGTEIRFLPAATEFIIPFFGAS